LAFRYLSAANAAWSPGGRQACENLSLARNREEVVIKMLQALDTSDKDVPLTDEQESEAYGIICDDLLDYIPPDDRRSVVWKMSKKLPRKFLPVIEYIFHNSP
jgi:hypothetical protein